MNLCNFKLIRLHIYRVLMEQLRRIETKTNGKVNVQKYQFIIYLFVKL